MGRVRAPKALPVGAHLERRPGPHQRRVEVIRERLAGGAAHPAVSLCGPLRMRCSADKSEAPPLRVRAQSSRADGEAEMRGGTADEHLAPAVQGCRQVVLTRGRPAGSCMFGHLPRSRLGPLCVGQSVA